MFEWGSVSDRLAYIYWLFGVKDEAFVRTLVKLFAGSDRGMSGCFLLNCHVFGRLGKIKPELKLVSAWVYTDLAGILTAALYSLMLWGLRCEQRGDSSEVCVAAL